MSAAAEAVDLSAGDRNGLQACWVEDLAGFAELGAEWDALVGRVDVPHPFIAHVWLHTWCEHAADDGALRVLTVRADGRLVGAAALLLVRERIYGMPVRVLQAMAGDHTPRFDFLVDPVFADAAFDALWQAILARSDEWDVLNIRAIPEESKTLQALEARAHRSGLRTARWPGERSPYVRFAGAWNRYFDSLGYNHRRNVGKGRRRLERLAPLELEIVTGGDAVARRLREGMRIETSGWKMRAGTAILSRPELQRFYQTLAARLADAGLLRLHFLRCGTEPIAFSFGILHRGTVYVLKGGYDPRYARFTPYNVLCSMVLRQGFAVGLSGYDFLGDDERWKKAWTRRVRRHFWLFVFTDRPRAAWLRFMKFRLAPILRSFVRDRR